VLDCGTVPHRYEHARMRVVEQYISKTVPAEIV